VKISCILTSYNRPRWVRHALKSVADQTHRDFELFVMDESDVFDVREAVREFSFPSVEVVRFSPSADRNGAGRLGVKFNAAVSMATGGAVCYLADDDYFFPEWFESASRFLDENPQVHAAFGKLFYSSSHAMVFPEEGKSQVRFFTEPVKNPANRLDHCQVIHRRFSPPFFLPVNGREAAVPDGPYLRKIAERYPFFPVNAKAMVKRMHGKSVMKNVDQYRAGKAGGLREPEPLRE